MPIDKLVNQVAISNIYKADWVGERSLGAEALDNNVIVFRIGFNDYNNVILPDLERHRRTGDRLGPQKWPIGPCDDYLKLRLSFQHFWFMPDNSLVLMRSQRADGNRQIHWGISGPKDKRWIVREEVDGQNAKTIVFHREMAHSWQQSSIKGVPLNPAHPIIIYKVLQTNYYLRALEHETTYLRSLILDNSVAIWESRPDWQAFALEEGWVERNVYLRQVSIEVAEHVESEIRRMADTAIQTAGYANGQSVLVTVKNKDLDLSRDDLIAEISTLIIKQRNRCALTGFEFLPTQNPHLRMSLDRKDSSKGYVKGNLQIVTRAANFYKSASDDADWQLKADALRQMAVFISRKTHNPSQGGL